MCNARAQALRSFGYSWRLRAVYLVPQSELPILRLVPVSVRDAALSRASQLFPAAREVAELVCVVPGKIEAWPLEQSAQPNEASFEGCLGIGMVRYEDASIAFRHELARRALEDSISRPRLQSLHAKVLAALAARPGIPAARLAHHADGARIAADVLKFAPVAAKQAAALGAHREAASHYQIALRYAEHLLPIERASLQEKLSYEFYLTAEHERAIEARCAALALWRAPGQRLKEGVSLRWLARLSWCAGSRAQADLYGFDAVKILEALPPGPELAMAYCIRAALDLEAHEADSSIDWAKRAIALAEPWKNTEILSEALTLLGPMRLTGGDTEWLASDRSAGRGLYLGSESAVW